MKHTSIFAAVSIALLAALSVGTGCGSSSSSAGTGGTTTTTTTTTTSSGTGGNPAPPTIGMQLDRMGRPAINTVLNHGFDGSAMAGPAKDAYNADSSQATWGATYSAQIEANLAIVDAVDGTCGNQILYAKPTATTSYATLAGALADDELYLNTAGTSMTQYLAVEANAVGIAANMDQGGRGLSYTVVDTTLSVLAIGALSGVSNGITTNNKPFSATFPYVASPN